MPKSKADPTGQAPTWRSASRVIGSRLIRSRNKILKLFHDIPRSRRSVTKIQNAASTIVYDYDISAMELQQLSSMIDIILNDELLESQAAINPGWYWSDIIERPYRAGTLEEANQFNQLIRTAIVKKQIDESIFQRELQPDQILFTRGYRQGLAMQVEAAFTDFKGLSTNTSKQVMQQINFGIEVGDTPTNISKSIQDRFKVAKSNADRIAVTEVNKAYNDAKIRMTDEAAEKTGLRAGVIHVSALIPTTRSNHAARHGNAYSTAQQQQWWNTGANRIRCLCTTHSVLIDSSGKVVETETQKEIKAEKSYFDEEGIL